VPAELWRYLLEEAVSIDPEAMFFAETLGCTEEEALALHDAGLHYFFNSSKWWDFEQPWCLEQHEKFGHIAPSISFPESHDTERLAADTRGNEAVQRQRYAFAAVFSAGLMMPIGYEFGFKRRLDVVLTEPADWETPTFDLQEFVKRVNKLKIEHPLLHGEGDLRLVSNDSDVLILERQTTSATHQTGWVLVNKRWNERVPVTLESITALTPQHRQYRICRDESPFSGAPLLGRTVLLDPAEVVLLLAS
jgi:starch synthase (maltosyl-transferring)